MVNDNFLSDITGNIEHGDVVNKQTAALQAADDTVLETDDCAGPISVSVTFKSESAAFRNTFGYFLKDTGKAEIIFADVDESTLDSGAMEAFDLTAEEAEQLQFFLIPDGARKNAGLFSDLDAIDLVVEEVGGVLQARDLTTDTVLEGHVNSVYVPEQEGNPDDTLHAQRIGDAENFELRWEDLPGGGDKDYNDAIIQVEITPDEMPTLLSIAPSDADKPEGTDTSTGFTFTITRTGNLCVESTVTWTAMGSTAEVPDAADAEDFIGAGFPTGTVTFAAKESTKTITVDVDADDIPEPDEGFKVVLSGAAVATIDTDNASAEGVIRNDDVPPVINPVISIAPDDADKNEGTDTETPFTFTITRTGDFSGESTVMWSAMGSTSEVPDAANADDFIGAAFPTGTVTFLADESTKTITLDVDADDIPENDEGLKVVLSDATGATIDTENSSAEGVIRNDDAAPDPVISIDATMADQDEGDTGATEFSFTVTRAGGDLSGTSSVDVAFGAGDTDAADFVGGLPTTQTVTFAANETETTVIIPVSGDTDVELDETFSLTLQNATGAIINTDNASADGVIRNDDGREDIIVWQNGLGSSSGIEIGTPEAPTSFTIGTDASTPSGDVWSAEGATDAWSNPENWQDLSPPTDSDSAIFTDLGAGGTNLVDENFAIASLHYTAAGAHVTDLNDDLNTAADEGSLLQVTGPARVGIDNPENTGSLRVQDAHVDAFVSELSVGAKNLSTSSDSIRGILTVAGVSTLDMLSATGDVFIGTNRTNADTASGELNALESAATVNIDVDDFMVARAVGTGVAEGTLRWNQQEAIHANEVYFGRGSNAVSTLDVPAGGTLRLGTEADRIGNLLLAYNDTAAAGTVITDLDFTVTNPTFEAMIGNSLFIAEKAASTNGDAEATLTLGSNSTLDMLSATGDVFIGTNRTNADAASGELNALESAATVNIDVDDFNVGVARGTGVGQGTLRWNQQEAIHANEVFFGRGSNAVSILDVPAGGTLRLGTEADRIGNLWLAYNDTGAGGTVVTDLDFTVTNPTFEALIGGSLLIAEKAGGTGGDADGNLTLGSNSTLDAVSANGDVWIGTNRTNSGTVNGELNATQGTLSFDIDDIFVGRALGTGVASGTFAMGAGSDVAANSVSIGLGIAATGTFDMPDGSLDTATITLETGAFDFTGGRLTVGTFDGTLAQDGGTLAPDVAKGASDNDTTINGDYELASAGTLEIELSGPSADGQVEQLIANGAINLNADNGAGGTLDVILGYLPNVSDSFVIVENDGAEPIVGVFADKAQGAEFDVGFEANTVIMQIDYLGGDGNDVELTVTEVLLA